MQYSIKVESNTEGDIKLKDKICYFITPVRPIGGDQGKSDWLSRLYEYGFL